MLILTFSNNFIFSIFEAICLLGGLGKAERGQIVRITIFKTKHDSSVEEGTREHWRGKRF